MTDKKNARPGGEPGNGRGVLGGQPKTYLYFIPEAQKKQSIAGEADSRPGTFTLEQLDCVPGTIIFDCIFDYLISRGKSPAWAMTSAAIFGAIFRFERMMNGYCHASAKTIAKIARCCVRVFHRHRNTLLEENLIEVTVSGKVFNPELGRVVDRPRHYRISPLAKDILSRAGWYDSESQVLPVLEDSRAGLYDFFAAGESHEEEDADGKYIQDLRSDLPSFQVFEAEFGRPQNGMLARIQQLHADENFPNTWLDEALLRTASAQIQNGKQMPYFNTIIRNYLASGGPTESALEAAPAARPPASPARLKKARQKTSPPDSRDFFTEVSKRTAALEDPTKEPAALDTWSQFLKFLEGAIVHAQVVIFLQGSHCACAGAHWQVFVTSLMAKEWLEGRYSRQLKQQATAWAGRDLTIEFVYQPDQG